MSKLILPGLPNKKRHTGIIIQARMTSARFPGKTVALFDGKPVIEHVVERALIVPYINYVIVAAPLDTKSQPIIDALKKYESNERLKFYFGDEHNVLQRFYEAAMEYDLDYIIRITADCPLIDPELCTEVIRALIKQKADYASNIFPERTFPKGLDCEAFTMDCLECAKLYAITDYDKEHVTPWMQKEPDLKRVNIKARNAKAKDKDENYCIDYPKDIPRLEKLIAKTRKPKLIT